MQRFASKNGLVTGAASRVGRATARRIADQGLPEEPDWKLMKPYTGRREMCEAEEVAASIAYLGSDEARFVHGAVPSIDGGVAAI